MKKFILVLICCFFPMGVFCYAYDPSEPRKKLDIQCYQDCLQNYYTAGYCKQLCSYY